MASPGVARLTPYVAHDPTPAQRVFLQLRCREALFGGAAGGGKSDGLLMAALQFADVPGYAALLLRRSFADLALPGALLDRAREWLGPTDARYSPNEHTWHFPSGASLTFGYLESARDHLRYQSAEFQFVAFDEVTQFPEHQYRFLFSRVRRPSHADGAADDGVTLADVPLRMRAASNPGGPGHEWVYRRFVNQDTRNPGTIFIPSLLEDNPYLDADEYEQALQLLDPVNYERLRRGDWSVKEGATVFDTDAVQFVDGPWPSDDRRYRRVRYWDLASTQVKDGYDPDETVGVLLAIDLDTGLERIEHMVAIRAEPHVVEATLQRTADRDGRAVSIFIEEEPGASGKSLISHYRRNVLRGYHVTGDRPTGAKENRIRMLAPTINNGHLSVVRGAWLQGLLDQMDAFPHVEHDDRIDALAGAHSTITAPTSRVLV